MGRFKYDQGEFEAAIDLFQRVEIKSEVYIHAKFFEGISFVRMRKARPAIAAFRGIVEGIDEGKVEDIEDIDRMRNLAWISLARIYYTAANRVDPETGSTAVDGKILGQAVEAWNQVTRASEYWPDAIFESSWAFFLADEYSRALGNVHTLNSPYFEKAYYPEALVLKAVTFFVNCQIDNAEAAIQKFHRRYDPISKELSTTLAKYEEDNEAFFEFLKQVRAGRGQLSPQIRAIVSTALSDRTILRNLEYVELLAQEADQLTKAKKEFRESSVGQRIAQDVDIAKSFAVDQAGDLAKARYNRLVNELEDLATQVAAVEIEILDYRKGQLDQEVQEQMKVAQRGRGDVEVDEEHEMWPFNGEWWRDELGFYRQQVTNQCSR